MPNISGPITITSSGVYKLTKDIVYSGTSGAAIQINASNVTIDLNGFTIRSSVTGSAFGTQTASGIASTNRSNIVVKNGDVSGFFYGVKLDDTSVGTTRYGGHSVLDVDVSNCSFRGIAVQGPNNVVDDCTVVNIQGTKLYANAFAVGIESHGPRAKITDNVIRNVYARDNGEALGISFSNNGVGSVATNNVIMNTTYDEFRSFGIWVGGGGNVTANNNTVSKYAYGFGWSSVTAGSFANNNLVQNTLVNAVTSLQVTDRGNTIQFVPGNNTYTGTNFGDTLIGNSGADTLNGSGGTDYIAGGAGFDTLDGGDGFDYLLYSDAAYGSFTISLADTSRNTGIALTDTYSNFEGIILSRGNDFAYGDANANDLRGGLGNDRLYGDAGGDWLYGEAGNDQLYGGLGADLLDGGAGFDYVGYDDQDYAGFTVSLVNPSLNTGVAQGDQLRNIEGLLLGTGSDIAYGSDAAEYIYGRAGDDWINGGGGNDNLFGEDGADTIYGFYGNDYIVGGDGDDTLVGDSGNDTLYGQTGADTLLAGSGNDTLDGGAGNDMLDGSAGNDIFKSNAGNDMLKGGTGADRFEFLIGSGEDQILDLEHRIDKIAISRSFGYTSAADVVANHTHTVGNSVFIDLAAGDTIELVDWLVSNTLPSLQSDIIFI